MPAADDVATVDWNDRQWRRRLCTALIAIIDGFNPDPDEITIVDLAEGNPTLTPQELEAVRAYFSGHAAGQL